MILIDSTNDMTYHVLTREKRAFESQITREDRIISSFDSNESVQTLYDPANSIRTADLGFRTFIAVIAGYKAALIFYLAQRQSVNAELPRQLRSYRASIVRKACE